MTKLKEVFVELSSKGDKLLAVLEREIWKSENKSPSEMQVRKLSEMKANIIYQTEDKLCRSFQLFFS